MCVHLTFVLTYSFLAFFFPYAFFLTYLLLYSFTSGLICLIIIIKHTFLYRHKVYFFQNRPILFTGQRLQEATKPGFSFFKVFFYVAVYFVIDACLLFVFVLVFQY